MNESNRCTTHDWWLDGGEQCPVCEGIALERDRIIKRLQDYLDLTNYSVTVEGATANVEWDNGFQAALALIKGEGQ